MPDRSRIARKDSDLLTYLNSTSNYLKSPYIEPISQMVAVGETESIVRNEALPLYMMVTLENTGSPSDADLHFCMASTDTQACMAASSTMLSPGNSQTLNIRTLSNNSGFLFLNVSNLVGISPGSCRVSFELNWQRLGLVEQQFIDWCAIAQNWISKYVLTQDAHTKTKSAVEQKNLLRKQFTAFAEPILNHIESSLNIVHDDRLVFNLPERDRTPTARPAISEPVITILQTEPGCNIRFTHRTIGDGNRSSILPISNGVEVRWIVLPIGAPTPATPGECTGSFIATKSIHYKSFGIENANKRFHAFFRWINTSEPAKNGPWSEPMAITIVN